MNRQSLSSLAAIGLLLLAGPGIAHHGTAGYYDQSRVVKITGIVKEFRWRNPHSGLFIVSKDAAGKEVVYSLEMGSPNTLARLGMSRNTFKPGDQVVADMHPSFGSPTSGELYSRSVWLNGKPVVTVPVDAEEPK
jgi:hypothetical protein